MVRGQGRRGRRWAGAALKVVALALLVVGFVGIAPESKARLVPYYIIRTADTDVTLRPRILFVLDTSGSMALRATSDGGQCAWSACESDANAGTEDESRISAARRAIQNVVDAADANATYALMTFDQNSGWASPTIPSRCDAGTRFEWVTQFYQTEWADIDGEFSTAGAWHLCQTWDAHPYPYLRWDNLGVGSVVTANDQDATAIPDSPLLDVDDADHWANGYRDVQWFDRWLGVMFQPNDTTDPDLEITNASTGDYGTTASDKATEVFGHDFYYWPYVDGFPGYAAHELKPNVDNSATWGGVTQTSALHEGTLYSPFYISDLSSTSIDPSLWGPASADAATSEVLARTNRLVSGGVDPTGVTPWRDVIGSVPGSTLDDNSTRSHTSVASYLQFVTTVTPNSVCVPTVAVVISDGAPYPDEQGGSDLYANLAALRTDLGVKTYVVGFFIDGSAEINDMACAAAGACTGGAGCSTPCSDTSANDWDTCADSDNPSTACAWQASSSGELETVLTQIVNNAIDLDVPSGPGATVNNFSSDPTDDSIFQTEFKAWTAYPSWKGYLTRSACTDTDATDTLLPQCVPPSPEFSTDQVEETFGPCEQSLTWEAHTCLAQTTWTDRRIYSHDADNNLFLVAQADGTASDQFQSLLDSMGLLDSTDPDAHADAIVAYLLGQNAPDDHKLPGLAASAPVIVRRIPPYRSQYTPAVDIRDPHCGGRMMSAATNLPTSLTDYAKNANDADNKLTSPSSHYEQQEAVIIADDMGVIHAFQLDSGNELFGLVPRFALESLVAQADVGAATYGQEGDLDNHHYGVSATLNHGWVFDDTSSDSDQWTWRHLGIIGMGIGGYEWIALDLSHMSPVSSKGPVEILWTSEDAALKTDYDNYNGETWARPALTYHVAGEVASNEPDAFIVMGSGYPKADDTGNQGRVLVKADALTGTVQDSATLPDITQPVFQDTFGTVVDAAVGSHCLSRFWAEAQETYIADPSGRLFRWDLGRETAHEADSGGVWDGAAQTVTNGTFPACIGASTCTVDSGNPGDPFIYAPAVSANDRIDDFMSGTTGSLVPTDQFLVAMISGSPAENEVTSDDNFHSSLYVLVDDHSSDPSGGFSIPSGAGLSAPGDDANYVRVPVSQIERTRTFVPYPGATTVTETRNFTAATRPIRSPRIFVTGAVDQDSIGDGLSPVIVDGLEVYYIEFTVYEPPSGECDPNWYDATSGQWYADPGQSYIITYRVTNSASTPFNLINGAGDNNNVNFNPNSGTFGSTGMTMTGVTQIGGTNCQGGECGATVVPPGSTPCNNNSGGTTYNTNAYSLTVYQSELAGFTPIE